MLRFIAKRAFKMTEAHLERVILPFSIFNKPKKLFFKIDKIEKQQKNCVSKEVLFLEEKNTLKKRKIYTYQSNYTAAIRLPYSNEELLSQKHNQEALLNLSKDYIIEHAARRVDLFFYLLIAYYRSYRYPIQSKTLFQHGVGLKHKQSGGVTEACHSSLFPSLVDIDHGQVISSLISDTHFYDSLNSTVELPSFVNQVDTQIEGKIHNPSKYRKRALEILQNVSCARMNPLNGMSEFFIGMNQAFSELRLINMEKQNLLLKNTVFPDIKIQVLDLERMGTFQCKWDIIINAMSTEYLEMMLRLSPEEKEICSKDMHCKNDIYYKKMKEIQQEIVSSKSSKITISDRGCYCVKTDQNHSKL